MQPTIIIPIVALIGLLLKELFGIELGQDEQQILIDGLIAVSLAVVAGVGIIKSHKEKKKSKSLMPSNNKDVE